MNEYYKRINRVIDHIENNLDKELTLDELARVSCFSRFHFNRIFSSLMGETLFQFIQRLRLEKAASLLCYKQSTILMIALDCGFSNSSSFSKSFKAFHGVSPSQWRQNSNMGQQQSNTGKEINHHLEYTNQSNLWRYSMDKKSISVEVKEIKEETVAYVRHVGPYAGDESLFERLFGELCQWAGPRNLLGEGAKFISIYHDNPEITEEDKLRISICVIVPPGTKANDSDSVNIMTVPGEKYAIGHFEIDVTEYGEAWSFLCGEWLSTSGFEPDDRPCFEMMMNDPKDHPQGKHIVDIYEPVKPI